MSSSRIIANTFYLYTLWLNTNILDDYSNTKKRGLCDSKNFSREKFFFSFLFLSFFSCFELNIIHS